MKSKREELFEMLEKNSIIDHFILVGRDEENQMPKA